MRLYCFCIRESSCVYLKQLKRAVGEDGPIGFPFSVLPLGGLEGSALCNNWRQSRFVLPLCVCEVPGSSRLNSGSEFGTAAIGGERWRSTSRGQRRLWIGLTVLWSMRRLGK